MKTHHLGNAIEIHDRHAHNLLIRISQFPWVKKNTSNKNFPNITWITGRDRDVKSKPATRCADGGYADLFDGLWRGGLRTRGRVLPEKMPRKNVTKRNRQVIPEFSPQKDAEGWYLKIGP